MICVVLLVMFCIIHASAQNEDPRHRRIAPRDTIRSAEVAIVSSSTGQLVDATLAVDITTTSSTDHVITTVLVPFPSSTTDCVYGCSTLSRPPYTGGNKAGITEGGKGAAIGCSLGGILLIGAGGFILRKRRMKRRIEANEDSKSQSEKGV